MVAAPSCHSTRQVHSIIALDLKLLGSQQGIDVVTYSPNVSSGVGHSSGPRRERDRARNCRIMSSATAKERCLGLDWPAILFETGAD